MLLPSLNVDRGDSQDTVSVNGEYFVKTLRSSGSRGNVLEVELTENVVILRQRPFT